MQEAEVGESLWVRGQPDLRGEILSQKEAKEDGLLLPHAQQIDTWL